MSNLLGTPLDVSDADGIGRWLAVSEPAGPSVAAVGDTETAPEVVEIQGVPVQRTWLTRGNHVVGLPPAAAGKLLLVHRSVARATKHRDDLVFPMSEARSADGRLFSSQGLGGYRAERRAVRRAARRFAEAVFPTDLVQVGARIAILVGVAAALLGASLGVMADIASSTPGDDVAQGQRWTTFALYVALGLVALSWAGWLSFRLVRYRRRRGTLYVVVERSIGWTHEEREQFLSAATPYFAKVLRVPGSSELGLPSWAWPTGEGLEQWQHHVTQLVRSLWAVHYNDEDGDNSLAFWTLWPVAWAIAQQATSQRRALELKVKVCRRPSAGRVKDLRVDLAATSLTFTPSASPAIVTVRQLEHQAQLTITARQESAIPSDRPVAILLVRMSKQAWGPLAVEAEPSTASVTLRASSGCPGLAVASGTLSTSVYEWRAVPAGEQEEHDHDDFPGLAAAAMNWIVKKSKELPDHHLLLGLQVPQEISAGFGLLAADQSVELPDDLWALNFARGEFVIPPINLGAASRRPQR